MEGPFECLVDRVAVDILISRFGQFRVVLTEELRESGECRGLPS